MKKQAFFWKCNCGKIHPVGNDYCFKCGVSIDTTQRQMLRGDYHLFSTFKTQDMQYIALLGLARTLMLLLLRYDVGEAQCLEFLISPTNRLKVESDIRSFTEALICIVHTHQLMPTDAALDERAKNDAKLPAYVGRGK